MSPLLTTYANGSARGYGAFSVAVAAGSFESIATVTVASGTQATIEFTSIPATYTHLQVRALIRSDNGLNSHKIQFNSDTGTNYAYHQMIGDGASVSSNAATTQNNALAGYNYSSSASTNGVTVVDILDYANTNKYKTVRSLDGSDGNGAGLILFRSGLWQNTNAITSIKFTPVTGNYAQYSHFALYGIKSA